eukprot:CAMPEP_0179282272 /NCGR_PEP_ID=MMETSP0797-20121207/37585_1 /TAXON_ID=47934 /ORGANISM="Dinophysis acuminata, Strain DAEP01" /LENGTH=103 /DNA_ID=CAMNT_0020991009 /DNA_START=264 /DNA_END=573 /DNA_ORIENTATION=-
MPLVLAAGAVLEVMEVPFAATSHESLPGGAWDDYGWHPCQIGRRRGNNAPPRQAMVMGVTGPDACQGCGGGGVPAEDSPGSGVRNQSRLPPMAPDSCARHTSD